MVLRTGKLYSGGNSVVHQHKMGVCICVLQNW